MKIEAGKDYVRRDGGVERVKSIDGDLAVTDSNYCVWADTGRCDHLRDYPKDLVSEVHESPVRTITRREIVSGRYGKIVVEPHNSTAVMLGFYHELDQHFVFMDSTDLRSAAMIFSQIAEALDDQ